MTAVAALSRPTLVLNRNWQPVGVANVARALVLLWNDSARVVDPSDYQLYSWDDWSRKKPEDGEPVVKTVRFELKAPEVIALTTYDKLHRRTVPFTRRNLFRRDRHACQYCGVQPGGNELTIDHVQPRSRGGATSWDNCVLACVRCNHRKADRTPAEARMTLPREPKRPAWNPVYSARNVRVESWERFLSEAYWNVELLGP
ncbi:HNH endonuclease [Alienimonas californiensis]|uniref:CRISPR-associated endonuclease Cas9 n=1 Tax=Alienimonas californiensis TaxID=2527989 RepID=A0A517P8X7_9PLAN|nr:HNH endonuclease [Alienimonas californiensis]QDT15815.1 CRISPR-associated endonuclease Cas9 [Alienimonas californiensis]